MIGAALPGSLIRMADSGTTIGTVVRWDDDAGGAVIEETIRQVEVALAFALRHVRP